MKIGQYHLHTIETGRFRLDGGAMFGIVPKRKWTKKINSDQLNRIELSLRCLLLKGRNKNILIDCGIGNKFCAEKSAILGIDNAKSNMVRSLNDVGLSQSDITDVILSHFHFDHAGGAVEYHDSELVPAFPNATYIIQRKNLDWALNPSDNDKASYREENIKPLLDHRQLKIVNGESEIFSGVQLLVFNGHTVGQQGVKISDGKKTLFFGADLIPTTSHLIPNWGMAYDLEPLKSLAEKKKMLSKAYENNWILFFDHDPEIEACTIKECKKGYEVKEQIILSETP